jgi:hypothetical protein
MYISIKKQLEKKGIRRERDYSCYLEISKRVYIGNQCKILPISGPVSERPLFLKTPFLQPMPIEKIYRHKTVFMTSVTGSCNALTGIVFLSAFLGKKGAATVRYRTVDFATALSQNGFSTYKLSLQKKTNIILKITKGTLDFLITFTFYEGPVGKQDHYMTLW